MPLVKSGSDKAFKTNVRTLMHDVGKSPHVQSRQQALAIAYATKRRGKQEGGEVPPLQITPQITSRFQRRLQNASDDGSLKRVVRDASRYGVDWSHMINRTSGGRAYANGGSVPYVERLAFSHMPKSGFVNSAVPGRTDRHSIHVAAGSYVLPADHVSALGQNNSLAGTQFIKKMFGAGGKYGSRLRMPKFAGGGGVEPVPIVVAGGEHILPPELVRRVGNGDLEKGFEKLDEWVLDVRKRHVKKLKGLAPPKKK